MKTECPGRQEVEKVYKEDRGGSQGGITSFSFFCPIVCLVAELIVALMELTLCKV